MHRLGREGKGVALPYVGAENWPFPIPLVSRNRRWRFDTDAGMPAITFRRTGENELTAIALSRALLGANRQHEPGTYPLQGSRPGPWSNAESAAEHALLLILCLLRTTTGIGPSAAISVAEHFHQAVS
jgi:hypothetical protein